MDKRLKLDGQKEKHMTCSRTY